MVQYSIKKRKMYEAAKNYFDALKEAKKPEELEKLRQQMDVLKASYSENPAYLALMEQKYIVKAQEVEDNEAGE